MRRRSKARPLAETVDDARHDDDGTIHLGPFPVAFHYAHAYTPRETGSYGGGTHLIADRSFKLGRLEREAGDALCKPARKFWGLTETDWKPSQDWTPHVCPDCAAKAARLATAKHVRPADGPTDCEDCTPEYVCPLCMQPREPKPCTRCGRDQIVRHACNECDPTVDQQTPSDAPQARSGDVKKGDPT